MTRYLTRHLLALAVLLLSAVAPSTRAQLQTDAGEISIAGPRYAAPIVIDPGDAAVVKIAADLLAGDIERVAGTKPVVENSVTTDADQAIIAGTLGTPLIDALVKAKKIDVTDVTGKWETFTRCTIDAPMPHVKRAVVVIGSDRRATAYGVIGISEQIGVSPWNWWADVPVKHRETVVVGHALDAPPSGPAVKYRGIFLNDEDFGLRPWASKTFDPVLGNLGPKTYEKLFELMLRLRLNYLWPAMHPGSAEFGSVPGNAATADRWAIVMGASHCEPMLRNNVYWPKDKGPWRYDVNRDNILNYWAESTADRGNFEAVWTMGIRGIHDTGMQGPKEMPARQKMLDDILVDQRELIKKTVTRKLGPVAQVFIPYKEVLPIYEAGIKIPDDVTIMWPDDNYGYMRRLPTETERKRGGGSGVYYHVSYWGSPRSYLWVESTPPALMWEELSKAYDNDARTMWVVNVGDLKPAEIAVDFYSRLAWDPRTWGHDAQSKFLAGFMSRNFGPVAGPKVAELQTQYYQLAAARKPEHVAFEWFAGQSSPELATPRADYEALLDREKSVAAVIPPECTDAYFEMIGYAARMLPATGLCYLDAAAGQTASARKWKAFVDEQTRHYNEDVAGGKWRGMMSQNPEGMAWPEAVGGKAKPVKTPTRPAVTDSVRIAAGDCTGSTAEKDRRWERVDGLGWSGRAITLVPSVETNQVVDHLEAAASVTYDFSTPADGDLPVQFDLLPTMRVAASGGLRFAVAVDDAKPQLLDVPGGTDGDEHSKIRHLGVLGSRVITSLDAGKVSAGRHRLTVYAVDPGVVIDEIELPPGVVLLMTKK